MTKNGLKKKDGVTLTELLIAVFIVSLAILTFVGTFTGIAKSVAYTKVRTLATSLAQEKMQVLKQQSYYKLLITSSPAYRTEFEPDLPYDSGYYPPETILEGGITFERLTYVQVAQEVSGQLQTLSPTTPDTGMKLVTVSVLWTQGQEKRMVQVRSVVGNPETVMANAIFKGRVQDATTLVPLQGALVNIAENVGWRATTNVNGDYTVTLSPGSYTLMASAQGYFSGLVTLSIGANQTITQNFDLTAMSSGTVQGTAWINNHLVISQVVASTSSAGFEQEYVELFNPTTTTWTIASGPSTPVIDLKYQRFGQTLTTIAMDYTTLTVSSDSYYLFANTGTVTTAGVTRAANAVFKNTNPQFPDIIRSPHAGAVGIAWTSNGAWIDQVGWDKSSGEGQTAPFMETDGIDDVDGFQEDEQYVRRTSTSGVTAGLGRAYDSGNNNTDFIRASPLLHPPRNNGDSETTVSGVPAVGTLISATDGLSTSTTAYSTGNPPYAEFVLPSVATGTWLVVASSGSYTREISTVVVTANTTTWIPNDVTDPLWPAAGYYSVLLSSEATEGFVTGKVTNISGGVINPAITVEASGGAGSTTAGGANGSYLLRLASGTYTLTANPNNSNPSYVSQDQAGVVVNLGQVTPNINFMLSQGGQLQGFVTPDGLNALPNVAVTAFDANGVAKAQGLTGSDGKFLLINLSTGTYSVEPALASGETSLPVSISGNVTGGTTVFIGTFTISGASGKILGGVSVSGSPIQTGTLIVASTTPIAGVPPALSSSTLTGAAYYSTSSREDGTYALEVRGSTTPYQVYAYYTTFSGQTPTISSRTVSNVSVAAGQTVSGVNFSW